LRSFDLSLGWKYSIHEKVTIEPSVSVFNTFNFSNFNLPPNTMSGLLTGSSGSALDHVFPSGARRWGLPQRLRLFGGEGKKFSKNVQSWYPDLQPAPVRLITRKSK
jgi:hypothetical protein